MPWPWSEDWNACAVPWNVALSVAGTRSSRWTASTCATASLSDTFGLVLNEIVTEGNCPRCVTVRGPSPGLIVATASSGTSRPVPERTCRRASAVGSCWYWGSRLG